MQYKAHDYSEIYEDLGINLNTLGCVMLRCETPDTSKYIPDDVLYKSDNPERFWIDGRVEDSHVTLRYGLLPTVRQEHVRRIMDDVSLPRDLYVYKIEVFSSPYEDDPYDCIVARVHASGALEEANQALSLLPNVNTFSTYKAHVTLAYVQKGWAAKNWLTIMPMKHLEPMRTKGLYMGKMLP